VNRIEPTRTRERQVHHTDIDVALRDDANRFGRIVHCRNHAVPSRLEHQCEALRQQAVIVADDEVHLGAR
jgi:hypothetical protein